MDEDCLRIVDSAAYWNAAGGATWLALACIDFFISVFLALKLWQERSLKRVSGGFSYTKYLALLGSAMFFISVSNFTLGIGSFLSDKSSNVALDFFGSKNFAAWQLLYSIGQLLLVASKVLVFVRFLHFCEKSSTGVSPQRMKLIRVLLWSIVAAYAVVSVISATTLFFDSFAAQPSNHLFEALSTAIVFARCIAFTSLVIVFAYGGHTRY
jgi:hypothetical protein